ncbi:MAG TPA: bifunctional precorrin-2 dehydrogenase/sirohydrochlorin ferrochelatase [Acidimicrobiales bacterium]|nr:bifunctional precorrin-2 dehydrogenase/sirohydrochlorin ferrochelatase [Acidimicrobiales bacterium]
MTIEALLFPVNLIVDGKDCLVVGDGDVADGKARSLEHCGALVTRIAAADFKPGDCANRWFVVSATGDPARNSEVAADADKHGVWINAADDPRHCSAILPAVLRRGSVTATVGTAGRSPAMATFLRNRIDEALGPDVAALVEVVAGVRDELRTEGIPTEGLPWQEAFDPEFLEFVAVGNLERASERLRKCLLSSSSV